MVSRIRILALRSYPGHITKADIWRFGLATSFLASILRSGPAGPDLPTAVWYGLQFGSLLVVGLLQFATTEARPLRRVDVALGIVIALYAACAGLSAVTSRYRMQTLEQSAVLTGMFAFLAVTVGSRWASERLIREDLTLLVALTTGAQLIGLAAFAARVPWAIADYGRFEGLSSNANYAGALSAIALALVPYLMLNTSYVRRWLLSGAMLLLVLSLLASGSRGALVGALAAGVTVALIRTARLVGIAAAALAFLLAVALLLAPLVPPGMVGPFSRTVQATDITSGRVEIYREVLGRWAQNPWLGTGYRTTELLTGPKRLTGHDVYLSVLAETGLIGAVIFITLLVLIVSARPRSSPSREMLAGLVAVLTLELAESSLFGWGSTVTLSEWLVLGAFVALGRCEALRATNATSLLASATATPRDYGQKHSGSYGPSRHHRSEKARDSTK